MSKLYFMSFAHVIQHYLVEDTRINVVRLLLEWITKYPGVLNKNGKIYIIDDDFARDLDELTRDVPRNIKKAVAENSKITIEAPGHFDNVLEQVIPQRENDLYEELWSLIKESNVATATVQEWKATFDAGECSKFLADVFLYAVGEKAPVKGKKKKSVTEPDSADVLSDIDILNHKIQKLAEATRPKPLEKPPQIAPGEHAFIAPLYRAYGSIDGKCIEKKTDLNARLQDDLEIRRSHFYAAETVRLSGASLLGVGAAEFELLEDEVFDTECDICFDDGYKNGYIRMKAVMNHIANHHCIKSVFARTGWVSASENKGICHILAGKKRLQWVLEDE